MTTTPNLHPLPELTTMEELCEERILLCGPCDTLMSETEYLARHTRFNAIAAKWTVAERTRFWYTLDRLCAGGNEAIRATPGLIMTPENLAAEDVRINRIAHALIGEDFEPQGFAVWGFYLYADPIVYSFSAEELGRYAVAKTKSVLSES
jgi:hypothetical protein